MRVVFTVVQGRNHARYCTWGQIQYEPIGELVKKVHASAVALASMVVHQAKNIGVLVNYPDKRELKTLFGLMVHYCRLPKERAQLCVV